MFKQKEKLFKKNRKKKIRDLHLIKPYIFLGNFKPYIRRPIKFETSFANLGLLVPSKKKTQDYQHSLFLELKS